MYYGKSNKQPKIATTFPTKVACKMSSFVLKCFAAKSVQEIFAKPLISYEIDFKFLQNP